MEGKKESSNAADSSANTDVGGDGRDGLEGVRRPKGMDSGVTDFSYVARYSPVFGRSIL